MEDGLCQTLGSIASKASGTNLYPRSFMYVFSLRLTCSLLDRLYRTEYEMPYVNFEILPLTMWSMWYETAPIATALLLAWKFQMKAQLEEWPLSRIRVWLEKLQPQIGKSSVELAR